MNSTVAKHTEGKTGAEQTSFILLAAGKGTRLCSNTPKVLHRLCGQTLLERSLRAVRALQPKEIVVVLGAGREAVEAELARIETLEEFSEVQIKRAIQAKQQGTGEAAQIGLAQCDPEAQSIALLPGDIPLLRVQELAPLFSQESSAALKILSCMHPDPSGFGRIVRDAQGKVQAIVEERDANEQQRLLQEINSSIYLVARPLLESTLARITPGNAQQEYYLTDVVALAVGDGVVVDACQAEDHVHLSGANTLVELSALEQLRRREIVDALQLAGVRFEHPESCYLDEGVAIGADTFVGANTRLLGNTSIGRKVTIEGDSRLHNATVGDCVHLRLGCYIQDAQIAEGCVLGPFVQLRPGTQLGREVKLGNFVEVKNARLADGVKANHLSYIGDASVGASSNIGAGTIFCNYDGAKKHHSALGQGVFVGSNSVLVSPVQIGDEAYIAAGSTITKDVPSKALGVGRSRQSNIDGWVERKRASQDNTRSKS